MKADMEGFLLLKVLLQILIVCCVFFCCFSVLWAHRMTSENNKKKIATTKKKDKKEYDHQGMRRVAFGEKEEVWKTVLTWGFFKASFREMKRCLRTCFSLRSATLGGVAPPCELYTLDGVRTGLESLFRSVPSDMPLILNIGSYSSPQFVHHLDTLMKEVYLPYCCDSTDNKARAKLVTIYIEEAHAVDEWHLPDALAGDTHVAVHRSVADRIAAAKRLVKEKGLRGEVVVDSMNNSVCDSYFASPERIYIILDGRVAYKGEAGPSGHCPGEVVQWLQDRYGEWLQEQEQEQSSEASFVMVDSD